MNIVFFNLREDEKMAVSAWQNAHRDINITTYSEPLTAKNKDLLKGFEGLVMAQVLPMEDAVYEYMKECGIKVLSTRSAGYDMYNVALLKKLGVKLTNVPSYSPNAIGEYALTAALQLSRNTRLIEKNVQKQDFRWQQSIISKEMRFSRVGILGTGRIGQAAAKLFKGIGAEVVGYDLYPSDAAKELLTYVSLDELLSTSDIISLHMPATADNHHMIDEACIAKMKDGAILVNTARGAIIDTKAVLKALDSGKLKGVALDTYEFEGPFVPKNNEGKVIDDPVLLELMKRDDVIYTPHIAFYTYEAVSNLVAGALDACVSVVADNTSPNEVSL